MILFDLSIFISGWLLAQLIFNGFERHVTLQKRLTKFAILAIVFMLIRYFAGRLFFWSLLGIMAIGIAFLHGYWFHYRHGIHWRTAEPRDKYLKLISKTDLP